MIQLRHIPSLVLAALTLALSSARALPPPPTGKLTIQPQQTHYYVGQTVKLNIDLVLIDCELGGNIELGGMPDASWARAGDFSELAPTTATSDGKLVTTKHFSTDLTFVKESRESLAITLGGSTAVRQQRGRITYQSRHPFRFTLPAVEVVVQPLPQPAPADFSGAVGRFALQANVEPSEASPGDLINLRWTLYGFGTLENFIIPERPALPGFKDYAPRVEEQLAGRRVTVAQVLVPQTLTANHIPEISFSVFDPELQRYETLTAGPFDLILSERSATTTLTPEETKLAASVEAPGTRAGNAEWSNIEPATVALPALALLGGLALAVIVLGATGTRARWLRFATAGLLAVVSFAIHHYLAHKQTAGLLELEAVAESRLCPSERARQLATIPAGAKVRVLEQAGNWLRVEHDGASGWILAP